MPTSAPTAAAKAVAAANDTGKGQPCVNNHAWAYAPMARKAAWPKLTRPV